MKRLSSLDFIQARRPPWRGWWLLGLAALLLLWTLLQITPTRRAETGSHKQVTTAPDARHSPDRSNPRPAPVAGSQLPSSGAGSTARLDAAAAGQPPWADLFGLMTSPTAQSVQVIRLDLHYAEGRFSLAGQAQTLGAMFGWLRSLEASPPLADVRLIRQEISSSTAEGSTPVQFEVQGRWRVSST